jgi:catechol 2,3-dioxygenase-like lactoylglutathione lyase family enzyme
MARIVGVNAIILYANDPAALAEWYARRLGLVTMENADDGSFYGEIDDYQTGLTFQFAIVRAPQLLPAAGRGLMVTYRVDDLDAFVRQLEAEGLQIERLALDYGRFARLRDPEGNPVELWALDPAPQVDLHHPPEV